MREIKFRAWDKEKSVMVTDGTYDHSNGWDGESCLELKLGLSGNLSGYSQDDGGKNGLWEHDADLRPGRMVLMQYTGLRDKNNKEIYEGDVVRMRGDIREIVFGKIGYDGSWNGLTGFGFKDSLDSHTNDPYMEMCYYDSPGEIEIIGNIYQNPELLSEKA
jgi:hypothetical protein